MNKGKDIHESIEWALDTGFSHIDTAQGDLNFLFMSHFYTCLSLVD